MRPRELPNRFQWMELRLVIVSVSSVGYRKRVWLEGWEALYTLARRVLHHW